MEAFENVLDGVGMVDSVVDDGNDRVVVRTVSTKGEAKKAQRLLVQEIADMGRATFPKDWVNVDDRFGPTLVGAFLDDRLVGAALVGPAQEYSAALAATCRGVWPSRLLDDALYLVGTEIAETPGIAVVPDHRAEGIGLRLKRYCDLWAAQHGAYLMFSRPTNKAACRLNEKAGHKVLEGDVSFVTQIVDAQDRPLTGVVRIDPACDGSFQAFRQLTVADGLMWRFRVGQYPAVSQVDGTGDDHAVRIDPGHIAWYEWDRSGLVRSVLAPAPRLEHDVSMGLRRVSMES
ncbi:GNAT family N-acetyltransferase [Bifidobacterium ruminantium]|nr:GNAT family N-acetyltransferase [Bifidobacterium ruminantium]